MNTGIQGQSKYHWNSEILIRVFNKIVITQLTIVIAIVKTMKYNPIIEYTERRYSL